MAGLGTIGKGIRAGVIESVGEIKPHKPPKHFRIAPKGKSKNDRQQKRLLNRSKNANRR